MQKITTFLTFNNQAEEAMNLYVSVFKDSKVLSVRRHGEAGPSAFHGRSFRRFSGNCWGTRILRKLKEPWKRC